MDVTLPDEVIANLVSSEPEDDHPDTNAGDSEALQTKEGGDADPPAESDEQAQDGAKDEKGPIPYSRFSEVVAARNAAKAEAEALRREVEAFRAAQAEPKTEPDPEPIDYSPEARIQRLELAAATKALEAEVAATLAKYPDVPEAVLYKAVAEDPSVDVGVVAQSYHNYVSQIEAKAVEKYLAANPNAARPQNAPPALRTSGSAGQQKSRPKSLAEAHQAMRQMVRTSDW